jgi:hypothetical protein
MGNFYANINDAYSGSSHAGTTGDPFSIADLNNHSNANPSGNVYNLQGICHSTISAFEINQNTWQAWNASLYGPWQIYTNNVNGFQWVNFASTTGLISGGIIFSLYGIWNIHFAYNCFFNPGVGQSVSPMIPLSPSSYSTTGVYKGCTFYGNFLNDTDYGYPTAITFTDCLIGNVIAGTNPITLNFYNCAIGRSIGSGWNVINCQLSWSQPPSPAFGAAQSAFNTFTLAAGVTIPPQPGNSPYTSYSTGLWGEARTGIGAVWFGTIPGNVFPWLPDWGDGLEMRYRFDTVIDVSETGNEQARAPIYSKIKRVLSCKHFSPSYLSNIENFLRSMHASSFYVPVFTEPIIPIGIIGTSLNGVTSIVSENLLSLFNLNNLCSLVLMVDLSNYNNFELHSLVSINSNTSMTIGGPFLGAFYLGKTVYFPVMAAYNNGFSDSIDTPTLVDSSLVFEEFF